jgi:glycosyltransferase involved in cell wall biosynthesis
LGDIDDISKKAIMLLSDQQIHEQFASNGLFVVKTKFRAEQIVGKYEQLYFKLLN